MPVRSLTAPSFFDPEFASPASLEPGTLTWLLAKQRSAWFPAWLFTDWRGNTGRGRAAWPPMVLATLYLLRWSEEGMSRRAAVRRAQDDVAWRGAMGLQIGGPTPSEKTLRDFEAYLAERHGETQVPRYLLLHEHIARACLDAGVVDYRGANWAMDSTPMWCYGAVKDTIRLLGDGVRSLAKMWAHASRATLESVVKAWGMSFINAKSTKGAFDIDWPVREARASVVTSLATSAMEAVRNVRKGIESVRPSFQKRLLKMCRNLMRVVSQDLEADESGQLVVARKVAKDRLISLTDPDARHGRKSKSQTFNGFKLHLLGEVHSGLIVSVAVTRGNEHDSEPALRLIRRAKYLYAAIEQVLGDTAYGGARLHHIARRAFDVKLLCPPVPVASKEGKITKADFDFDFDGQRAFCPQGIEANKRLKVWTNEHQMHSDLYQWDKSDCAACPRSEQCRGASQGGRRLLLHPYEKELRDIRADWEAPGTKDQYKTRSQCERLVNQLTRHGGRKARAFGLKRAQVQAHGIASANNLRLLAVCLAEAQQPRSKAA